MSKASPSYLVIDPALTTLRTAQRLTPAQYAQFVKDSGDYKDYVIVPYTQAAQRQLHAQLKQKYGLVGYNVLRRAHML